MKKKLSIVSIVGRQNVGKSTLFNSLVKQKKAIVDSAPGLTRDIITCHVSHESGSFILSDTPGLDISDSSELSLTILNNARNYLEKSSAIILLLENPAPASFDYDLAQLVRKLSIPVIAAVNKMDSSDDYENINNFYELGFSEIIPISALGRVNINLLLEKTYKLLNIRKSASGEPDFKLAIVGRPNSGKSTLLNSLSGFNRSVVSDTPGTTRDSVDEDIVFFGKRIRLIDTAGMRKKGRINDAVDYYSVRRTVESIAKSNIIIHLIDATTGFTDTDKKIADQIFKVKKPHIIAINKWDLVEKTRDTFKDYKERLVFQFYKAEDAPVLSISAKNKQRVHKLMKTVLLLFEKSGKRIETAKLNKIIEDMQKKHRVPMLGDRMKIYYITQTGTMPLSFRLFVNSTKLFRREVVRYIEKTLQNDLDLEGIPLVLDLSGKDKKSGIG